MDDKSTVSKSGRVRLVVKTGSCKIWLDDDTPPVATEVTFDRTDLHFDSTQLKFDSTL